MNKRTKIALFSLTFAVALLSAAVVGAMSTTPISSAASTFEPVQPNCTPVTVTNVSSQSVAAGQGEKITVDWTFAENGCFKAEGFEVWIEVTRRTGRKNNRKIDASSTARSVNVTFTEAGVGNLTDAIKTAKVVVTAKLGIAKDEKTQGL